MPRGARSCRRGRRRRGCGSRPARSARGARRPSERRRRPRRPAALRRRAGRCRRPPGRSPRSRTPPRRPRRGAERLGDPSGLFRVAALAVDVEGERRRGGKRGDVLDELVPRHGLILLADRPREPLARRRERLEALGGEESARSRGPTDSASRRARRVRGAHGIGRADQPSTRVPRPSQPVEHGSEPSLPARARSARTRARRDGAGRSTGRACRPESGRLPSTSPSREPGPPLPTRSGEVVTKSSSTASASRNPPNVCGPASQRILRWPLARSAPRTTSGAMSGPVPRAHHGRCRGHASGEPLGPGRQLVRTSAPDASSGCPTSISPLPVRMATSGDGRGPRLSAALRTPRPRAERSPLAARCLVGLPEALRRR